MEGAAVTAAARSSYMATLPAQVIKVERAQRGSRFETITEEEEEESNSHVVRWDEECSASLVAFGEAAPAAVITVTRAAFRSRLETIWEETMQFMVAEFFVAEAADAILRSVTPVLRLNHPNQFFVDSRRLEVVN